MHNHKRILINYAITLLAFLFFACTPQEKLKEDLLWYQQPANNWNEALPMGNGKLGVMIFGNTSTERIQLNDDSMWPADSEQWDEPDGNKNDLNEIRELLFAGNNTEADQLL